jgi:hypothetical protein
LAGRGLQRLRGEPLPLGLTLGFLGVLLLGAIGAAMAGVAFGSGWARGLVWVGSAAWVARGRPGPARLTVVAALALAEPAVANAGLIELGDEALWLPAASPVPEVGPDDRLCVDLGFGGYALPQGQRGWEGARAAERATLDSGFSAVYRVRSALHHLPFGPAAVEQLCSVPDACDDACARFLGARWLFVPREAAPRLLASGEYRPARELSLPEAALLEDLRAPPYAAVRPARLYERPWETVVALHRRELDPGAQALLAVAEAPPGAASWMGQGQAQARRPRPDRLEVQASADGPGVLVVREAYSRDWQGTLDGRPAPVLRVNLGMLGLAVPPGAHRVVFEHHPWGWPWAFALYGLALIACLTALVRRPGSSGSGGSLTNPRSTRA